MMPPRRMKDAEHESTHDSQAHPLARLILAGYTKCSRSRCFERYYKAGYESQFREYESINPADEVCSWTVFLDESLKKSK